MEDITIPTGYDAKIEGDKVVFIKKESNDEKIRKAIFKALSKKDIRNVILAENIKVSDALVWLERQKEQKPEIKYVYPKFRKGDVIEPITPNGHYEPVRVVGVWDGSYSCRSDDDKAYLSLPIKHEDEYRLVEQKFDDVKREWWNKGYLEGRKNAHIPARELGLPSSCDFQKEQESALSKSEIDFADAYSKGVWGKLMSKFKNTKGYRIGCNDVSDIVLNAILDAFKWVRSRRNSAEWSEQDEQMLIRLCRIIHGCTLHRDQTLAEESEIGKWVDKWINHNPQPRWKPRDAQMEALKEVVDEHWEPDGMHPLYTLYYELKKLI